MGKLAKAAAPRTIVNVSLDVGDWLDVMDAEGTWNVAQVIRFPTLETVEVRYDGWGPEFNEVVPLNSERVAPYHMYTWSVKVWAKYKNWPWWPSIVTIRSPGTLAGRAYLENEERLFVDFLDRKDITKRCRCWVERSKITAFDEKYDERRKRTSGSDFENSLTLALKSTASSKFPVFAKGTLPALYETEIATPVKKMKKQLGMQEWAGYINTNRSRHRAVYMYKSTDGAEDDEEEDDEEDFVVQFADLSDNEGSKKKTPRGKGKGKGNVIAHPRTKFAKSGNGIKVPKAEETPTAPTEVVKPVVKDDPTESGEANAARVEEFTHIVDAQIPKQEQPLYLPPLEDQDTAQTSAAPASDKTESLQPGDTTASADQPDTINDSASRKRKNPDSPVDTLQEA